MRGKVGVVLGASGDTACLTAAIGLPLRLAEQNPATPKGEAYTRNAQKSEFYLVAGAAGAAGALGLAGVAAGAAGLAGAGAGSGLLPSIANFSILAPDRIWSSCAVTASRAISSRSWSAISSKAGGGALRRSSTLMTWGPAG